MGWSPSPEPSSPYPSRSSERCPPNRAPAKRDAPFPEPSNYLSKFPANGLPRYPIRPLWRQAPISRIFFYSFPSKSPVSEPPPPHSPTGSLWREKLHLQSHWFTHSFIFVGVPDKSPPMKNGENIWSPSTESHVDGRSTYSGVRPGSPRGSFKTPQSYPSAMQPAARYLPPWLG